MTDLAAAYRHARRCREAAHTAALAATETHRAADTHDNRNRKRAAWDAVQAALKAEWAAERALLDAIYAGREEAA